MGFFDNNNMNNNTNNNNNGQCGGFLQKLLGGGANSTASTMLLLVVIIIVYIIFGQSSNCTGITSSTISRTKLQGVVAEDDNAGFYNESGPWSTVGLYDAMKDFYNATGVMPYIYIYPDNTNVTVAEMQEKADSLYQELFSDEGHFVTTFLSSDEKGYFIAYHVGTEARKVMDDEALAIFNDYMKKYYTDGSLPTENVLPNVYSQTRATIMTTETKKTTVMVIVVVVLIGLVYFFYSRKRLKQSREPQNNNNINNPM